MNKHIRIEPYEVPRPESLDEKEVYAFFGLASYSAQCLEKALVSLAFTYHLSNKDILTIGQWDELFSQVNKRTFGALLRVVKEEFSIDESMIEKLNKALSQRNWLAHDFFYDRAGHMVSDTGRGKMIGELSELLTLFNMCDQFIEGISTHIWSDCGITQEMLEAKMEELKNENA